MLKEKLLPLLLNRFDLYFEKLGTHLIILQKKYNIKKYIDNILKKIKKFFSIICSVQKFIIPYLKEAMKKAKTEGVNIGQIISDFIDKLLSKIDDILKPFKEFVNKVFDGKEELEAYKLYENVIKEGYQIVRKKGIIEQYEKIKKYVGNKYNETKEKYLDKRKEICNLPDELEKKFEEKKNELIEKYRELKEKIINSTNDIIKELKDKNSSEELREYFKNLKKNIIDELDEIKNEAKNKVKDITSIIPNFFDNFTNLIDNIMGIKFGPFNENKIDICKHITTFILEVEQGNIKLKEENEEGEIIEKDPKELLIKYLNEKLDIKAENSMEIVEYLFKNGLKSILIEKINNTLINYANKKLENIKSYYEPSLTMIKKYFATMKGDVSTFIEKCNNKINEKIDCFDVVIKFISNIFENKSLYEFYCMIEENILIHNDLKNPLLEGINQLKDKLVGDLSNELEAQIQKLYEKIINSTKYKELKEKSKKTINDIVDKAENKVFGFINKILENKIEANTEKEKKESKDETDEKEHKDENKNENKNKKDETDEKENKDKKLSEFELFDKNIGKIIDNKICTKSLELEQKLIKYVTKIDEQSQEYLKLKFGNKIDKKNFDFLFNSINTLKEKKDQFLNSEGVKNNLNKVNDTLLKIAESEHLEKAVNFIDKFDIKLANEIVEEIESITPLLEEKTKEDFRDNIKKLIIEKINKYYEKFLEPQLKELVINTGKDIFDKIAGKITKNK